VREQEQDQESPSIQLRMEQRFPSGSNAAFESVADGQKNGPAK
jgi:hypothetical protein